MKKAKWSEAKETKALVQWLTHRLGTMTDREMGTPTPFIEEVAILRRVKREITRLSRKPATAPTEGEK